MHSVLEGQSTDVAFAVPNENVVAVAPVANPVPSTVTLVPPAVAPWLGITPVTVGRGMYSYPSTVSGGLAPARWAACYCRRRLRAGRRGCRSERVGPVAHNRDERAARARPAL